MSAMGDQAFGEMKKKEKISHDKKTDEYVHCVINPLLNELDEQRSWEIVVFDEPETVNAFALPGGKIGVYTGIFKTAKNQHQLAAVVGHEIGHVIARHGNERVSTALAAQGGVAILGATLSDSKSNLYPVLMAAMGLGVQFGVLLPHGRTQESEADIMGLQLMAKAGFNPEESVQLWKNMQASGGAQPPEWLSTHPSNERRIRQLQENMTDAKKSYAAAQARGKHPNCTN
jgi:predicted Zn-dependent protease